MIPCPVNFAQKSDPMKRFASVVLIVTTLPAIAQSNTLAFTEDVAYSKPSFYFLAILALVLLGGIFLFQSSVVALAKAGKFQSIEDKIRRILRNGVLSMLGLLGVLLSVIFLSNENLLAQLHLDQNAYKALALVISVELVVLASILLILFTGSRLAMKA
jgi:hypothetical protein